MWHVHTRGGGNDCDLYKSHIGPPLICTWPPLIYTWHMWHDVLIQYVTLIQYVQYALIQWVTSLIPYVMSHVPCTYQRGGHAPYRTTKHDPICHTYVWVMIHVRVFLIQWVMALIHYIISHMSCTYQRGSRPMNESCHTYKWVTSHDSCTYRRESRPPSDDEICPNMSHFDEMLNVKCAMWNR